jgi:hypothetical protein
MASPDQKDVKIQELLSSKQARQDVLKEGLLRFLKTPTISGEEHIWTTFSAKIIAIADGIQIQGQSQQCQGHNFFDMGSFDISVLLEHIVLWKAGSKPVECPGIWRYWLDLINPSVPAITGVVLVDADAVESVEGADLENVGNLLTKLICKADDVYITSVAIPDQLLHGGKGGMTLTQKNKASTATKASTAIKAPRRYAFPFYFETNWEPTS